jgi:hypothetical protein
LAAPSPTAAACRHAHTHSSCWLLLVKEAHFMRKSYLLSHPSLLRTSCQHNTFVIVLPSLQVMNNKQNKQMLTFIGGFAAVLLLLYYLLIK